MGIDIVGHPGSAITWVSKAQWLRVWVQPELCRETLSKTNKPSQQMHVKTEKSKGMWESQLNTSGMQAEKSIGMSDYVTYNLSVIFLTQWFYGRMIVRLIGQWIPNRGD